ncbi:MAG: hypothetical protein N3D82_05330 [Ignisphaera sp.]|nr:hypothetical protein [Ignisphaera sp.]MCX8168429.1 hypothetical protein [Ignisphaera sp.]MDW8086058.1 hypothetical protein [Ignisphaera sp.]
MHMYVMLGLFKGERFEYARALVDAGISASFVIDTIAEALKCSEELDRHFNIYIPRVGSVKIDRICVIDKAIIDSSLVELKTVFNVIQSNALKPLHCEAILGRDVHIWWGLV